MRLSSRCRFSSAFAKMNNFFQQSAQVQDKETLFLCVDCAPTATLLDRKTYELSACCKRAHNSKRDQHRATTCRQSTSKNYKPTCSSRVCRLVVPASRRLSQRRRRGPSLHNAFNWAAIRAPRPQITKHCPDEGASQFGRLRCRRGNNRPFAEQAVHPPDPTAVLARNKQTTKIPMWTGIWTCFGHWRSHRLRASCLDTRCKQHGGRSCPWKKYACRIPPTTRQRILRDHPRDR